MSKSSLIPQTPLSGYLSQGQTYDEQKYKERLLRNLNRRGIEFGFQLTPLEPAAVSVS
jgi:hypothetical protein